MRVLVNSIIFAVAAMSSLANAKSMAVIERIDADTIELTYKDAPEVEIWVSMDQKLDANDQSVEVAFEDDKARIPLSDNRRAYLSY